MTEYKTIKTFTDENIKYIQLNNPQQYNKLSQLFLSEFETEINKSFNEKNLKCLIVYGHENVFSSGGDLKEISQADYNKSELMCRNVQSTFSLLQNLPIPVIACLRGIVFGGGLELALHCDIRFCSENTQIKMPEANIGLIPGAGGISLLSKYFSPGDTAYFVMSGYEIPLSKALQAGIIQSILPDNEIFEFTIKFAKELSQKPNESIKAIKSVLYNSLFKGLNKGFETEAKEFSSVVQKSGKLKIKEFFNKKSNG